MVSSEGACAAYYNFGRLHREAAVTLGRSRARFEVCPDREYSIHVNVIASPYCAIDSQPGRASSPPSIQAQSKLAAPDGSPRVSCM